MTDTQTNIRRIAEIIRAIDTSVASISTIQIYPLEYANAKELATVITQLFAQSGTSGTGGSGGGRRGGGGFGGFGGFGGPGGGGGGGQPASAQSEARQANSRVIAVADDQSNSLIVSAPEELIPNITEVIRKIDTSITDVTDTRIFKLLQADAIEMASIITNLYSDSSTQNSQRNRDNQGGRGGFGGFGGQGGGQQPATQTSGRALQQAKVVAVGDPRTNSLVVTAGRDTMAQIAEMVGRLDSSDSKKQKVYFHSLQHADADSVANVLRGMLGDQSANTLNSQSGAGRLNQRSASGAGLDTSDFSSSSGGSGRGGGGR
jgi:general secretion pathway protein D